MSLRCLWPPHPTPHQHEAAPEQPQTAERPLEAGPSPDAHASAPDRGWSRHLRREGGRDGSVQDRGRGGDLPVRHHVPVVHAVVSGNRADVEGAIWSVIQLLVLATVIGYAGAAWGQSKATAWWRPLVIGGSVSGPWCWCCGGWRSAR